MIKGEYILLIISLIWIIADIFVGSKLFELNYTFTKWLQGGIEDTHAPRFLISTIITQFGYPANFMVLFAFGFITKPNKIQSLKLILYTLFSIYILSIIKLFYHAPRPYFVYPDLQGIGCNNEFGKPSGHAMVTLVIFYLLLDSYLNEKFNDFSNSSRFLSGNTNSEYIEFVKVVVNDQNEIGNKITFDEVKQNKFLTNIYFMSFYVIFIFLIGFSRVMLGVHSFDQVILGWSYGIICVVLYRLKLDNYLENILLFITHKGFHSQRQFNQYVMYMILSYVVLAGLNLISYILVNQRITQEDRDRYVQNILSKPYCSSFRPNNLTFLADKCFVDSASAAFMFGILITITYTKGNYNPQKWNESYAQISFIKKVIRVLIIGAVCVIPLFITHFLKLQNIYFHYFFKATFQAILFSVAFIKVVPWAKRQANVDIDGDFLQVANDQLQVYYDSQLVEKHFTHPNQK